MKVIVKRPDEMLHFEEVSGLEEINQIVGNIDENGNGLNHMGSDICDEIFPGIEMYMKADALVNADLPKNFWNKKGNKLYFGTIVIVGYICANGYHVCSLTDGQIATLKNHLNELYDIGPIVD